MTARIAPERTGNTGVAELDAADRIRPFLPRPPPAARRPCADTDYSFWHASPDHSSCTVHRVLEPIRIGGMGLSPFS